MNRRGLKADKTGRTKGAKLPWESCHVEINNGFRQEGAWKALNASARVVYVELKSLYNGFNNGKIMASERFLAEQTGFSKTTVSRALLELIDRGFVREKKRGVLGVDGKGTGTCWVLTELGCLGERSTKDFKKWQPKGRILGQKRTQGGSGMNPGKPSSGSGMNPGWVQNEPREGPKTADPCTRNEPNLIDIPGRGVADAAAPLPHHHETETRQGGANLKESEP